MQDLINNLLSCVHLDAKTGHCLAMAPSHVISSVVLLEGSPRNFKTPT